MNNVTYELNVAYKGKHDFTVTVGKNGPDTVSLTTAKMVARAINAALDGDYETSLTVTTITSSTHKVQS